VGKIDYPHDAEDQSQTAGDQEQQQSVLNAVKELDQKNVRVHRLPEELLKQKYLKDFTTKSRIQKPKQSPDPENAMTQQRDAGSPTPCRQMIIHLAT
jgi:hypothetical protein